MNPTDNNLMLLRSKTAPPKMAQTCYRYGDGYADGPHCPCNMALREQSHVSGKRKSNFTASHKL